MKVTAILFLLLIPTAAMALKPGDYSVRIENPSFGKYSFCIDSTPGPNIDDYKKLWCSSEEKSSSDDVDRMRAAIDLKLRLYKQRGLTPPLPRNDSKSINTYLSTLDADFEKRVLPLVSKKDLLSETIENAVYRQQCVDRETESLKKPMNKRGSTSP